MLFTDPQPFEQALDSAEVRSILPTAGNSAQLRRLGADVLRRAQFSATVQSVKLLQLEKDVTNAVLSGQMDEATGRLQIKQLLAEMGYVPDPEAMDGIKDLSSDVRTNLVIQTSVDTARGFGWYAEGQDPIVLDAFPAQELYDTAPGDDRNRRKDVADRWAQCGGQFAGDEMIALKNDPIWQRLADLPDGLGNPYDPLWYNTHWRTRDVDRARATELELIDDNTEILPQSVDLNANLQASPDVRDAELQALAESTGVGKFDDAGVFVFNDGGGS